MQDSILNNTKKVLGIDDEFLAFDPDIIIHINSALSVLHDLGVGPEDPLIIEGPENKWDELELPANQLSMAKSYLYLKVRIAFDPPATSFHIEALNHQIEEHEYRMKERRELLIPVEEREEVHHGWWL